MVVVRGEEDPGRPRAVRSVEPVVDVPAPGASGPPRGTCRGRKPLQDGPGSGTRRQPDPGLADDLVPVRREREERWFAGAQEAELGQDRAQPRRDRASLARQAGAGVARPAGVAVRAEPGPGAVAP